jgi:hypothetical protein
MFIRKVLATLIVSILAINFAANSVISPQGYSRSGQRDRRDRFGLGRDATVIDLGCMCAGPYQTSDSGWSAIRKPLPIVFCGMHLIAPGGRGIQIDGLNWRC